MQALEKKQTNLLSIIKTTTPNDIARCQQIRRKVFVFGQHVPEAEEIDGLDPECTHYLLLEGNKPAGTARIYETANSLKIQRVCILESCHGRGYGRQLMEYILTDIQNDPRQVMLGAQLSVIPFYEKLGFVVCGEQYIDAGIQHKPMRLP